MLLEVATRSIQPLCPIWPWENASACSQSSEQARNNGDDNSRRAEDAEDKWPIAGRR